MKGSGGGPERFRLISRRSPLALIQAQRVARRLGEAWPGLVVEVVGVDTEGDRRRDRSLPEIGGKGLFTADLEARLKTGEVDAAVHSLKDLPVELPDGLRLACVPERADPADLLLSPEGEGGGWETLPSGAVVGTSSLRRAAQTRARRPDLEVRPIRGNVETRLRRYREGTVDALILAAAGLARLGLAPAGATRLQPPAWLPAPGQGALGLEARAQDRETERLLAAVEDPAARAAAECERALLALLEGGCQVPLGAWARREGGALRLDAAVWSVDGRSEARAGGEGSPHDPVGLGREVAEQLLDRGAGPLLAAAGP